jgi:hypothetical protein
VTGGEINKLCVEHIYIFEKLSVSTGQDMNILLNATPDDFNATN